MNSKDRYQKVSNQLEIPTPDHDVDVDISNSISSDQIDRVQSPSSTSSPSFLTASSSPHDYDYDPHPQLNHRSPSSSIITQTPSPTANASFSFRRSVLTSRNSRGSYSSVLSTDHGGDADSSTSASGSDTEQGMTDDHHDDAASADRNSYLSGERSPLTQSFDNEEADHSHIHTHIHTNTHQSNMTASSTATSPTYPAGHLFLDEDDDDDDDYYGNIKRYAIGYSRNDADHHTLTHSLHGGGNGAMSHSVGMSGNASSSSSAVVVSATFSSLPQYLWYRFQLVRQQARQRRAQLLLQQSERNFRQSMYICLMSTACDATDAGIGLIVGAVCVWCFILWQLQNYTVMRTKVLIVGLVILLLRFSARPLFHWFQEQRRRCFRRPLWSSSTSTTTNSYNNSTFSSRMHGTHAPLPSFDNSTNNNPTDNHNNNNNNNIPTIYNDNPNNNNNNNVNNHSFASFAQTAPFGNNEPTGYAMELPRLPSSSSLPSQLNEDRRIHNSNINNGDHSSLDNGILSSHSDDFIASADPTIHII